MVSSATTTLTIPGYTLTANPLAITISSGSSNAIALTLTPAAYSGTVTLATISSSGNVTAGLSSSSISMASGAQSPTLTISTSKSAANHAPTVPWKSGGAVMFCAVLLGTPITRRRKHAIAVLMTAFAISLAGLLVACGGGGGSSQPRIYMVTVTPTGSGTVTNAVPVTIVVTVQ